jgi:formylmethanofuran dehydrogenase subunit E
MIPDNYDQWEALDREQAKWLNSLPKCSICKEPIQQERAFEKNGFWICYECYEDNQRMVTE